MPVSVAAVRSGVEPAGKVGAVVLTSMVNAADFWLSLPAASLRV